MLSRISIATISSFGAYTDVGIFENLTAFAPTFATIAPLSVVPIPSYSKLNVSEPADVVSTRSPFVNAATYTLSPSTAKLNEFIDLTEKGLVYHIYDTDTEPMIKIKEFMALYRIVDIKLRMLKVSELKKIMGFPDEYVLIGKQSEKKKYIGNAVEVNMARVLCESLVESLQTFNTKTA